MKEEKMGGGGGGGSGGMRRRVSLCFTPSQPVWLYQGNKREKKQKLKHSLHESMLLMPLV